MLKTLRYGIKPSIRRKQLYFTNSSGNSKIDVDGQLKYYGHKKQIAVSLKALMETGKGALLDLGPNHDKNEILEKIIIQVACFLHRELPVRLAHRAIGKYPSSSE